MKLNIFKSGNKPQARVHVSKEPKYLELDWSGHHTDTEEYVRVLAFNEFSDVEGVLEYLRDRNNIVILKIKPRLLQEKLELKRALKRIQRTCQAVGGDIAGVREDVIIITPPQIKIARKEFKDESPMVQERSETTEIDFSAETE